ncbi:hypothetical protein Mlab_0362 [Methanocorpusculum labreanum Z]|uniref:Uncharacterized protein n=1 Tax=Methanocorpusculum labreanum (strain ATCC 43576 / DSM 4855 / Z) TaxID=410358 RepID=A2SQD2_METLZ|nr:type IV pilin [Methanocorpusculum labreanum]ABN06538.1 hypothetical protein Mlab_0362 [Methanocorpusculum labreanum Z]
MARRLSEKSDDGVSPAIAILLIIALTVILCAILMVYCMSLVNIQWEQPLNRSPPEILTIISVDHYDDKGKLTYESIVTLRNIGTQPLKNSDYRAEVFINGKKEMVVIKTLQAHDFISTNHFGIQLLYGIGPIGYEWEPGKIGVFDLNDRLLHPGDILQIDIIDNNTSSISYSQVISRSIFHVE